jgi:IS30 family transposase
MSFYSHLSSEEREQIAILRAAGHGVHAIAKALGRHPATISRELKRNRLPSGGYSPRFADGAYIERRQRSAVLEEDEKRRQFVVDRLSEGWSPEQISGWLKSGAEPGLAAIATETIYAFIYRASQAGEKLWLYLCCRKKRRGRRKKRQDRITIKDRASIHDRPQIIDTREETGHWEGDLMFCGRTRPVLVLHERKSRFTMAARLTGKNAAETAAVIMSIFRRLSRELRKSITFDNGTEFAHHSLLRAALNMSTWFCDAYASWQKGGVENANGRLRRWLPRQLDIDNLGDDELQEIVMTYNLTPRKCLGYRTPFQAILKDLGKDVQIRFA